MTVGSILKLFSIAYDVYHNKTKKITCIILRFIRNILLYRFKTCSKSWGTKLIKSFNTHLIPIKFHKTWLLSVFMFLYLYNIDLG